MRRISLCFLILGLSGVCSLRADETMRAAQDRLKTGGFYSGEVNGRYDSDTAAAITRYQIRNGLQITGKLDIPTSHALGVAAEESEVPLRGFGEDAWRRLRKSDQEYLDRLTDEEAKVNEPGKSPATSTRGPAPDVATNPPAETNASPAVFNRERLR